MTELKNYLKPLTNKNAQLVTSGCCQWRGSASYDCIEVIETFVLRRKFSGEIATEQQPPAVRNHAKKIIYIDFTF